MAGFLSFVPAILGAAGTLQSAKAAKDEAAAKKRSADFEAAQLEQQAGQLQAESQRSAADQNRLTSYATSRARAVAAASGGTATDKTVTDVIGRIAQEGSYRSAIALYGGSAEARQMNLRAAANRYSGEAMYKAGDTMATAHVLSGAGSLFAKYGDRINWGNGTTTDSSLSSGSGLNNDAGISSDSGLA